MSKQLVRRLASVALPLVAGVAAASSLRAQPSARVETDSRWTPWLGCWSGAPASDSSNARGVATNATCVIPIAGSSAVEALTIARGKVVARDRLDANVGSHPVNGQGCKGAETVNWSSTGRRVYLRADYTCAASAKGASSTIYAISSAGDWLYVQAVRSGGGVVSTVDRRHPIDLQAAVPAEAARVIGAELLSIKTARAAATAPITSSEIIDAVHDADATAVRSWVLANDQTFDVDGGDLAALSRADVPSSVLQAIMASASRSSVNADGAPAHDVNEYLNRPGFNPAYGSTAVEGTIQPMTTMYVCPPTGCFPTMNAANAYSPYNGYEYVPGSYYPYNGYVPYPLAYPGGFITVRPRGGEFRGPFHEPPHARPPTLPGPTGRRP
jgi:hypothetical protein